MKSDPDDGALLEGYLLGTLSDSQELRLERQYLADPGLQEKLQLAEDDLLEAHLDGDLDSDDRKRLQARFLASPRGQSKLAVARALQRGIEDRAAPQPASGPAPLPAAARLRRRWPRRVLGIGAPLGAAALAVIIFVTRGPANRSAEDRTRPPAITPSTPEARATPEPPTAPPAPAAPGLTAPVAPGQTSTGTRLALARLVLRPGVTREAGGLQTVLVPERQEAIEIDLLLDDDQEQHPRYTVLLLGPADTVRWRMGGLKSRPLAGVRGVRFSLPTSYLGAGEHTFVLSTDRAAARRGQSAAPVLPTPIAVYNCLVERR